MIMKIRKNPDESEKIDNQFDFSFHHFPHKSKQEMVNKLEAVSKFGSTWTFKK